MWKNSLRSCVITIWSIVKVNASFTKSSQGDSEWWPVLHKDRPFFMGFWAKTEGKQGKISQIRYNEGALKPFLVHWDIFGRCQRNRGSMTDIQPELPWFLYFVSDDSDPIIRMESYTSLEEYVCKWFCIAGAPSWDRHGRKDHDLWGTRIRHTRDPEPGDQAEDLQVRRNSHSLCASLWHRSRCEKCSPGCRYWREELSHSPHPQAVHAAHSSLWLFWFREGLPYISFLAAFLSFGIKLPVTFKCDRKLPIRNTEAG